MNLCNYKHDEICFEGRKCPFCEKIAELEAEIASRDNQISSLNDERADLNSEVTALQNQLDSFTDC
jgi:uncharacterized coiled-coil protein SlyX